MEFSVSESSCGNRGSGYGSGMETALLESWVNINSGTGNRDGLSRMAAALEAVLRGLPGSFERITPAPVVTGPGKTVQAGDLVRLSFRKGAPVQVLFSGHMDTVYGPEHPFQRLTRLPGGKLHGPGVADMKGGLFIMIESVRRFLAEDKLGTLGGEILINADEETGSVGSHEILEDAARRHHLGLVFESCLPGGELVRCRKGTGTFQLTAHGRAAHTGRDFENGRNAVAAMSLLLTRCHELNGSLPDAIVNVANFLSPGPVNVVPDHATASLNIRIGLPESVHVIQEELSRLIREVEASMEGIRIEMEGGFLRAPKTETPANAALHEIWNAVERDLGLPTSGKRDTGGSSDGNIFGAVGLPHLDGVGIMGGAIHSDQEYAMEESIPRQIARTTGFLHRISENPHLLQQPPFTESR